MNNPEGFTAEGLYQYRTSELAGYYLDKLELPPSRALDYEQRNQVYVFENELMSGRFQAERGTIKVEGVSGSLSQIERETRYLAIRHELNPEYFLTEEGRMELRNLGLEAGDTATDITDTIRRHALDLPAGSLAHLRKLSVSYTDQKLAHAVENGAETGPLDTFVVFENISPLFRRANGLFKYKHFLKEVSALLKENEGEPATDAAIVITKVYRKRINGLLSELEPDLISLWEQVGAMDPARQAILRHSLQLIWPRLGKVEDIPASVKRYAQRLDRLRNGVAQNEGRLSAVGKRLEALQSMLGHEAETIPAYFTAEEIHRLDKTIVDSEQMADFCRQLLEHFGKLSSLEIDAYDSDRSGRAEDGLWQVVVTDSKGAMEARDPPGIWVIPEKFSRSVTNSHPPVGVASGMAHEYDHIVQNDNARKKTGNLRISREQFRGRGAGVLKEAGAKLAERLVQKMLFGRSISTQSHYLAAVKAMEQGGSEQAVARAFYDSYMAANPDAEPKSAAESAVRGTKRFTRRKGGFDTEALNYAETALILAELEGRDPAFRDRVLAEGSYNLEDMAALHEFGLWNSGVETFPLEEFIRFTGTMFRQFIG